MKFRFPPRPQALLSSDSQCESLWSHYRGLLGHFAREQACIWFRIGQAVRKMSQKLCHLGVGRERQQAAFYPTLVVRMTTVQLKGVTYPPRLYETANVYSESDVEFTTKPLIMTPRGHHSATLRGWNSTPWVWPQGAPIYQQVTTDQIPFDTVTSKSESSQERKRTSVTAVTDPTLNSVFHRGSEG